jgi:hypothetical protein
LTKIVALKIKTNKTLILILIMVNIKKNMLCLDLSSSHQVPCRYQVQEKDRMVEGEKTMFNKPSLKSTNFTQDNIQNSRVVVNLESSTTLIEWRKVSSHSSAKTLT